MIDNINPDNQQLSKWILRILLETWRQTYGRKLDIVSNGDHGDGRQTEWEIEFHLA